MSEIGKVLLEGLDELLQKLRNDERIEATEVRRIETPDGPVYLRRKVILGEEGSKEEGNDSAQAE